MRCIHMARILMLVLLIASCAQHETPDNTKQTVAALSDATARPDGHNSRNALDWAGTYSGVLPCASCPGIDTVVSLHSDGTFERTMHYLDQAVVPHTASGTFSWNDAGTKVELNTEGDGVAKYQVGENQLFHLDGDGQRITGELAAHYVLHKHQQDESIEGKHWRLIELRGRPAATDHDALLLLDAKGSIVSGNASCNAFTGSYAIKAGQRIRFGQNIASTKMACPDMSTELAFFEVLRLVDNYSLSDSGELSLNKARMAPLARFEPVETN